MATNIFFNEKSCLNKVEDASVHGTTWATVIYESLKKDLFTFFVKLWNFDAQTTPSPQFKLVRYFSEGAEVWAPPGLLLNIARWEIRSDTLSDKDNSISYQNIIRISYGQSQQT